jgi:hypothetical protein
MQDRPVCFSCIEEIETNAEMVFESPCGCDEHSSAVFHAICLFDWRDRRKAIEERFRAWIASHRGEQEDG